MRRRMGLAVLAAMAMAACSNWDPLDSIEFREYADTGDAVRAIVDEVGSRTVYAIGEYHPTRRLVGRAPIDQFATDILPLLPGDDIVVEAWPDASCTRRTRARAEELPAVVALVDEAEQRPVHALAVTCLEYSAMLDPHGRIDYLRLLAMISDKLRDSARQLLGSGKRVIIYGGALHNDLYPRWMLDELAYGHQLELDHRVVEMDVVSREVVLPIRSLWSEAWFPLVRASPDRALVWERAPDSYVLILPE